MFTRCCDQKSHVHRLIPQDVDGLLRKKGTGSVPDPFGLGAYTASDKALRGKSGLVHETRCVPGFLKSLLFRQSVCVHP